MPVKLLISNPVLNAWIALRHAYYSIIKCEDSLFNKTGLTSEKLSVLMVLKHAPAPVTQKDVADWLDKDNSSITYIIDKMSHAGLVERKRDLKDRRSVRLVITPSGEELFDLAREPTAKQLMEIMSCLSESEILVFTELVEKIREKTFKYRNVNHDVKVINPKISDDNDLPWPLSNS
jgi:DNA-binding MarR family transcriptional regulator